MVLIIYPRRRKRVILYRLMAVVFGGGGVETDFSHFNTIDEYPWNSGGLARGCKEIFV
jgi:hypothetical protein